MHAPNREQGNSVLHRASAALKLVLAGATAIGTALLPRRPSPLYLIPAVIVLAGWAASRMPFRYAIRKLLMAEIFVIGVAVLWVLSPSGEPLLAATLLKSNLCILTMMVLSWTTPFHELLVTFRRWHVPPVMLSTLALMVRYLPVLSDESQRMQRARASRTFSASRRLAWHNLAWVICRLFLRGAERAERIYLAMCARGWR